MRSSEKSSAFIIGPPRSGSTALYQAITAALELSYINNLSCSLSNSLPVGFRVSKLLYGGRAHRCFTSKFGNTRHCGWNAPAECGDFWYRWLPRDRHFVDFGDIKPRWVRQIRSEIVGATKIAGKPIVFKNLNAGQRLRLLYQVVLHARIIHITRDIRFNVQSIMSARRRNGVPSDQWWSIKPPNYERYLGLSEVDLCVAQVKALEAQIAEDRQLFPARQWMDIQYEDLTQDPDKTVRNIADFLDVGQRSRSRWKQMVSAVRKPNGDEVRVPVREWEEICRAVENPRIDKLVQQNTVYE